jgi:hypothetical protein
MTFGPFEVVADAAAAQSVVDAARSFVDARAVFLKVRTSSANGLAIAAARRRRDLAIEQLVDAVEELDRA